MVIGSGNLDENGIDVGRNVGIELNGKRECWYGNGNLEPIPARL